jgi:TRAP-type transport system small permease protein
MKVIDKFDQYFIILSTICLFIIMVIVSIDGLLRQFFDAPIVGAYELVEKYLMPAMIFSAISYTWAKKGHIGVTVMYDKMPKAVKNITHLITLLLGMIVISLIGYTGMEKTMMAIAESHTTSGLIRWPLWLAYVWMPIGSFLFFIRLLAEFIITVYQIIKNGLSTNLSL